MDIGIVCLVFVKLADACFQVKQEREQSQSLQVQESGFLDFHCSCVIAKRARAVAGAVGDGAHE